MSEKVLDAATSNNSELSFLEKCRAAELRVQADWALKRDVSGDLKYQGNVWEKEDLSDEDRLACLEIIKNGIRDRKYAQPAVHAVFADDSQAKFLDDFLWNHMGDPVVTGLAKPKKPGYGDGLSEYNYDYQPRFNGYTEKGILLNVRETHDKDASDKERYAIILGNMATLQVARYRINEVEILTHPRTGDLEQKLIITTDTFDAIDGKTPYDDTNTASGILRLNESIVSSDERHEQQASLTLSKSGISYKPFGGREQEVGGINRVVLDRHFLSRLARAAGVIRDDNATIELPHSYLHPKAA